MKIIKKTIQLPTYGCEIEFNVSESVGKRVENIYKKYNIVDEFGDEAEGAVVMPCSQKYYLIIGFDYLSHNTIAHEVYHAAVRITEDRHVTDEEAQAWLAGYLSGVIYKFLEKKNLQIKHG